MILADKIINERKKNGWSQEELAEKLAVSRQSVSKWESAQAVPDLQKILKLAEIFNVSTDYLLKDEIEPSEFVSSETSYNEVVEYEPPLKRVSMQEANDYLAVVKKTTGKIAIAVAACVFSPVPLILMAGMSESGSYNVTENMAAGLGVAILLLIVAASVFTFITTGMYLKPYEYLKTTSFETEYGVSGMVKALKNDYAPTFTRTIAIGVILCIVSCIPVVLGGVINASDMVMVSLVGVLLTLVAIAVYLFVSAGSINNAYNILLEEDDYTRLNKASMKKIEPIMGIYWAVVVAGYLAVSFITNAWHMTWVVWPVAGVASGIISAIAKIVANKSTK